MRSPAAIALAFVLAVLAAGRARAAGIHHQSFHVGERAAGLAGAFTALADEATGAFYNPAGIVDITTFSIGLTVSAYQLDIRSLGDQLSIGDAQGALRTSDFTSFPAGFGYVRAFGERLRQALGLTIVVPDNEVQVGKVVLQNASLPGVTHIDSTASFRRTDRTLWFGATYAARPHSRISLGASLFYLLRNFQSVASVLIQGQGGAGLLGDTWVTRAEALHGSLLVDVGLKLRLTQHLRLGISLRSPNRRIHRSGSRYDAQGDAEPLTAGGADLELESNLGLRLSMGIAWEVPQRWALALDVRVHGAVDPYFPIVRRFPNGVVAPDLIAPETARDRIVNLSLGGEYYLAPAFVLRGGFFTNFSAQPALRLDAAQAGIDRVHLFGGAAAFAWVTEKTTLGLTVNYSRGAGEVVGTVGGFTAAQSPVLADASRQFLTLLLGGSYRL